jgi:hypothetical protein
MTRGRKETVRTYKVEARDSEYISRPSSPASAYIVEATQKKSQKSEIPHENVKGERVPAYSFPSPEAHKADIPSYAGCPH